MKLYRRDQDGNRRLLSRGDNIMLIQHEALATAMGECGRLPNSPKLDATPTGIEVRITYLVASYEWTFEESDSSNKLTWESFIRLMHSGTRVEVEYDLFAYFLGVLPPATMGAVHNVGCGLTQQTSFGFAEGKEAIVGFWHEGRENTRCGDPGERYFCAQTVDINTPEVRKLLMA